MAKLFANSEDPDQTLHSAASDLGLHCLPITLLRVFRLQWVKFVDTGSTRRPTSAKDPMERVKNKKILKSSFFLDSGKPKPGDGTGYVFRKYPPPKPVRKSITHATLPDTEEQITSKDVSLL